MNTDNLIAFQAPKNGETFHDALSELVRQGARQIIAQAVEAELNAFLAQYAELKDDRGRQAVVRNGYLPERTVLTGVGVEPGSGFYIQNANQISGRKLDLVANPPTDLVVEVDITSPSARRLEIYKSLQIPEVWRCTQESLEIKRLQNGEYISCEYSLAFPMVSSAIVQQFLEQGKDSDDDNAVIRSLRSWIQQQGLR